MSKISITEKFAQDAINAPALVTGGKKWGGKNKKSSNKNKSRNKKSGSKKSGSRNNGSGCCPPRFCK